MALIWNVNFSWSPLTMMRCMSGACQYDSEYIIICPTREEPPTYYCFKHLLVAATNIHALDNARPSWL